MNTELMETHLRVREGIPVVDVRGDIIAYTGTGLKQVLLETVDGGAHPHVLVNLHEVGSMDSSGLGALIEAMKQARPSALHFYACTSQVVRLLAITGLDRIFNLYASEEDALAHARTGMDAAPPERLKPALL